MISKLLTATGLWQGVVLYKENLERRIAYSSAQFYAKSAGKPLLVVGGPGAGSNRSLLVRLFKMPQHGCGDVCLDLNAGACSICGAEVEVTEADVRQIPYGDGYFGAAFISHVLEHLPTVDDAAAAVDELYRVADAVFIAGPSKQNLYAWIHPDHHLWVRQNTEGVLIQGR